MKQLFLISLYLFSCSQVLGQSLPDYYLRNRFLQAPPAAFEDGLIGFVNPANLALLSRPELRFFWSTDGTDQISLNHWGVFSGMKHFGFAIQRQKFYGVGVTDFRISSAFGSRALTFGLAYGWSAGRFDASGRQKLFSAGTIYRPTRFFSLGLVGNFSLESSEREGVGEIGIRPLGTPKLTLFADAAIQKDIKIKNAPWSMGAALQLVSGLHLVGRYFNSKAFSIGLTFDFGTTGIGAQGHFNSDSDLEFNSYMIRLGGFKPSFLPAQTGKRKRYVPFNLVGRVDHLKYVYFDDRTHRLLDILTNVQAAIEDARVSALALNLSSMQVRPEHAWEIREALKLAQGAGKKVIIFIDNAAMTTYHLASVADKIVMDPQGSLMLQGYAMGRTYLKGTLEKLGLGFDEWRFFKYKSAMESYSRDSMSDADREQVQDFVDDWYELTRAEVSASRKITKVDFDRFIDEEGYIMPEKALAIGLVDTLARWSGLDDIITSVASRKLKGLSAGQLFANSLPKQNWGVLPKIAVVYGLGVCAMDDGIRARWLEKVFLSLASSQSVKAVVFRVDSPGGDGMASDLVAEALKKCSENKPVIISQGQVAGSGGYWISMYGDTIVAGANTITGSIGVIGGWIYDKGFSEKLGLTSDLVQRGKHADLGQGVNLPYLNIQVPARNLTEEERTKAESSIRAFYDIFVKKVASGRNMSVEKVRQIAEGHIYSGNKGKEIGLVDEIGGMLTAISIAKQSAGIKPGAEIEIVEIPNNKGLVNLRDKLSLFPFTVKEDPVLQFIKLISEHPGQSLPLLLPWTYPDFE